MNVTSDKPGAPQQPQQKRAYGGLSAQERSELQAARLVEAAIDCFGTIGYVSTTIDGVCTKARVSTRDFYTHFAGKDALLLAVYEHIIKCALTEVAAALEGVSPDPAVAGRRGLETFINVMVRDERWARINFIEIVGVNRDVELRRREAINAFAQLLRSFAGGLARAGNDGWSEPSELRSIALVGAVHELLTDWILRPDRATLELLADELTGLLVAAVRPPAG